MYLQIARMTRLYTDPYVSLEMAIVKKRLEDVADLPFPVKFSIIDSTGLDAFATIGGYVYVTTGILEQADKEEEIAGILGHELPCRKAPCGQSHREGEGHQLGVGGDHAGRPAHPEPGCKSGRRDRQHGGAEQIGINYTREAEEEADRYGVATTEKAGYNGFGSAEFLKKLASTEMEKRIPQYLLTHPYSETRVATIRPSHHEDEGR